MKPFVLGMREKYGEEENYAAFEGLYTKLISASEVRKSISKSV
jgi:hypothetical protein